MLSRARWFWIFAPCTCRDCKSSEKEMLAWVSIEASKRSSIWIVLSVQSCFSCFDFLIFLIFFFWNTRHIRRLPQDALLKAAMVAGFAPNMCLLYRGQRSPPPGSKHGDVTMRQRCACLVLVVMSMCFILDLFMSSRESTRKFDRKLDILWYFI